MNRYENGKIYKIVDVGYNKCYIGSTCEKLSQRMARHKACYNQYLTGKTKNTITSFILFDEYGFENCKIELIENFSCNNKEELLKREGFFIEKSNCVNRCLSGRNRSEYSKYYREKFPEEVKQTKKICYENNAEHYKEKQRLWKKEHEDFLKEQVKCDCGAFVSRSWMSEHIKTQKHQDGISEERHNKTQCSRCGAFVRKGGINRHQKTSKCQSSCINNSS